MKIINIEPFIEECHPQFTYPWALFMEKLGSGRWSGTKIEVPDFQRAKVWTREQKVSCIENMLR
jgi:hypothetical protein